MRVIDLIVIHCSDSDISGHDNISTVQSWHTLPKMPKDITEKIQKKELPKEEAYKYGNGWKDIGYHYFISKNGAVYPGRAEETVGAHVSGHNSRSIGICLSGKIGFTGEQFAALEDLVKNICNRYALKKEDVLGHCDLQPMKTCPNFDLHKLISGWDWH